MGATPSESRKPRLARRSARDSFRESQASFGDAVRPIVECSISVTEGRVYFHIAKVELDSNVQEKHQFDGSAAEKTSVL